MNWREKKYQQLFHSTENIYRSHFKRNKKAWNITIEYLSSFNQNQLGYAYYQFLKQYNLTILPKFERHDMMHILTGTNTEVKHELALQYYLLGNGKLSLYQSLVLISSIFYIDQAPLFFRSFIKGIKATSFHHLDYEPLLHIPTNQIINNYNILKLHA